ncbi:MAG: glutamate--tRNA ligase [Gammaproteobacteria bacterium]
MQTGIRLRFAPSPTGAIHLGNARTALFNFLLVRRTGGTFLIRIEDTDQSRSELRHEASLLSDLRWLGLDWEEGPDVGGPNGPYRQSERSAIYTRHLSACFSREQIYPCFCSIPELAQERALQEARGLPPRYSGRCGRLSRAEGERRLAQGEQAVWRWRVGGPRTLVWEDLVFGTRHIEVAELGDFVISRTDGSVGFLFANAVDDLEMGVSHVLRGEDHLSNTARQILMNEGFESPAPKYGHLPLLVNPGGAPLAKREGALSIGMLRNQGFLPEAVRNYLARLGHPYVAPGLLRTETLIREFDLGRIGRARAVLDPTQLAHWQKQALAELGPEDFAAWGRDIPGGVDPALAALVRENTVDYPDLALWRDRLTGHVPATPEAHAVIASADPALLHFGRSDAGEGDARAFLERYRSEYPGSAPLRQIYPVLRAVLTGSLEGPELARVWAWFSPEGRRQRFEEASRVLVAQSGRDQT